MPLYEESSFLFMIVTLYSIQFEVSSSCVKSIGSAFTRHEVTSPLLQRLTLSANPRHFPLFTLCSLKRRKASTGLGLEGHSLHGASVQFLQLDKTAAHSKNSHCVSYRWVTSILRPSRSQAWEWTWEDNARIWPEKKQWEGYLPVLKDQLPYSEGYCFIFFFFFTLFFFISLENFRCLIA